MTEEGLYARIRRETTEKALKTGRRFIFTLGGVPHEKVTLEEVKELIPMIQELIDQRGPPKNPPGLTDFVTGQRYDWEGMKELIREVSE